MSDRITIINNKNGTLSVNLNQNMINNIPDTNLDPSIHAVQWYGDHGVIEYNDRNEKITDFSEFDIIMQDRQSAVEQIESMNTPEDVSRRMQRDKLIKETDWIVVKYLDVGGSIPQEWSDYRQSLRDVPEQSGFPDNVDWPEKPTTTP